MLALHVLTSSSHEHLQGVTLDSFKHEQNLPAWQPATASVQPQLWGCPWHDQRCQRMCIQPALVHLCTQLNLTCCLREQSSSCRAATLLLCDTLAALISAFFSSQACRPCRHWYVRSSSSLKDLAASCRHVMEQFLIPWGTCRQRLTNYLFHNLLHGCCLSDEILFLINEAPILLL